jgi:hypothetical protein
MFSEYKSRFVNATDNLTRIIGKSLIWISRDLWKKPIRIGGPLTSNHDDLMGILKLYIINSNYKVSTENIVIINTNAVSNEEVLSL